MSTSRIELTALISSRPGSEDQMRTLLRELVAHTVQEPGCINFQVFERIETPGEFVLWEIFESAAAFRAHMDAAYTKAYFASGLTERTQVIKQQLLSSLAPAPTSDE